MFKKSVLHLSLAAALLTTSGFVLAASTPTNIAVSATVSQGCSISTTTALAFGAYDPIGANASAALNATGQVSVACSKGATGLTIGMDNGTHVSGTQRQMQGTTAADLLQYNLFQPPTNVAGVACTFPGTIAWNTTAGAGVLTLTSAPTKAARLYNVCGTIPGGQDATTGAYTDTVIATLNF
ncbi:MAG: spore coat U domain-containing protein [Proteobacteria bacterium]|nr:spore coat U domain-containing protein [Pseudomonadota bacterium]